MKGFPDLPPIWLLLALGVGWFLATYLPLVQAFGPAFRVAGLVLSLAGIAAIFWSAWWFWRKKTTIEPHHTPGRLIVEGPYVYSRNPIYLGMAMILTGAVLWWGALSAVPLPLAFVAIIHTRFVLPEEAALRAAFGTEAEQYIAATRAWF